MIASMALYSRLLKKYPERVAESQYWEKRAIEIYGWSQEILASQSSTDKFYIEEIWKDDMALGAIELFRLTDKKSYLADAETFFSKLENPFTFDYANIHLLMYYKLGLYSDQHKILALSEIKKMLAVYGEKSKKNPYGVALDSFYWGSHMHIQGTAFSALFYDKLSDEKLFSTLALKQWDYLMGMNQWGMNFISGAGSESISNPHHQIAQIKQKSLPGYWSPGPVPQKTWVDSGIKLKNPDALELFNTAEAVLHIDSADYITNEPALTSTATGILLAAALQKFADSKK